jgi:hypothetical protein
MAVKSFITLPSGLSKLISCLRVRPEPPRVKYLSSMVRLLALPKNIRLGWKGLQGTNSLAYYVHLENTAVKKFYNI